LQHRKQEIKSIK